MATIAIDDYAHMWTTQRKQFSLITMKYCGKVQLFIYHKPTKKVMLTRSPEIDRYVVQRMLDAGVAVIDDNLLSEKIIKPPCIDD